MAIRNLKELQNRIESDSSFVEKLRVNPEQTLRNAIDPSDDPKIFKIVLYFVGFALIFCLVVAAVISLSSPIELINADGKTYQEVRTLNQFFVMIGSAAIGALAGLLVPRPDQ